MKKVRSRRKKRNKSGLIIKLCLLLILAAGIYMAVSSGLLSEIMASSEQKPLSEWLEVGDNEVRIYLDNEADFSVKGRYESDKLYLPVNYAIKHLNSRFFWSEADRMLSYTLPDETIDIRESEEYNGAAAFTEYDGEAYVQADIIAAYSHIVITEFCGADEPAKRAFIDTAGTKLQRAVLQHKTSMRTKRDLKSPVLTTLNKGDELTVIDSNEQWSSVVSETGYSGFVRTKYLGASSEAVIADNYAEPKVEHTLLADKPVMGWHGIYTTAGNSELDNRLATAGGHINVLSPTWIQISDAEGNYVNYSSEDYIAKAHAAGCQVWVSVDNFNQSSAISDFNSKTFFESSEKRRDFIARLMTEAGKYGYDGLNLDFEGLKSEAGASYAQFFRELSVECRKAGLVLSIDNYVPYDFNDFYRLDEQGIFADYVVIMLYDEHTQEPGSNSSLSFVDYGLDEAAKDVETDRIIAALPLYTRLWNTDEAGSTSSQTMSMTAAKQYAADKGVELKWDETIGQYYGEFELDGIFKQLWLEDENSLKAKLDVISENAVGGIAFWRLGYDSTDVWKVIDAINQG